MSKRLRLATRRPQLFADTSLIKSIACVETANAYLADVFTVQDELFERLRTLSIEQTRTICALEPGHFYVTTDASECAFDKSRFVYFMSSLYYHAQGTLLDSSVKVSNISLAPTPASNAFLRLYPPLQRERRQPEWYTSTQPDLHDVCPEYHVDEALRKCRWFRHPTDGDDSLVHSTILSIPVFVYYARASRESLRRPGKYLYMRDPDAPLQHFYVEADDSIPFTYNSELDKVAVDVDSFFTSASSFILVDFVASKRQRDDE